MLDFSNNFVKIGSVSLISTGLLAYFLLNKKGQKNKQIPINRQILIKVIKEFDKEFYLVFRNIALLSAQINQQSQGKLSQAEIKEFILNDPGIQEEFKKIEDQTYSKFNTSEKIFRNALENQYKNDIELQDLQKKIELDLEKAIQGEVPNYKTEIPDFLTFEKVLELLNEIMMENTVYIFDKIQEIQQAGYTENPLKHPTVQQSLNPILLEKKKILILFQNGLNNFSSPSSMIFSCAIEHYIKENPIFKDIFKVIENHHQKQIIGVIKGQKMKREEIVMGYQSLIKYEMDKVRIGKILEEKVKNEEKGIRGYENIFQEKKRKEEMKLLDGQQLQCFLNEQNANKQDEKQEEEQNIQQEQKLNLQTEETEISIKQNENSVFQVMENSTKQQDIIL